MKAEFGNHNRDCAVSSGLEPCCEVGGYLMCTLRKGHPGNHQACTGHTVLQMWPRKKAVQKSSDRKETV